MALKFARGSAALRTTAGSQALSIDLDGETPKFVYFWLVRATTNDSVTADAYIAQGATDGARAFCEDAAYEDAVASSVGRRGLVVGPATTTDVIRTRRADNTADVSNNQTRFRYVSFAADTINIDVLTSQSAYVVHYWAGGGSDLTAFLDDFTTNVNDGATLDRTGLGVPADAAILVIPRLSIGVTAAGIGLNVGFWAAMPHSGPVAISSLWGQSQNPPAVEQEIRDDVSALGITGSSHAGCFLTQLSNGYRVHATLGQTLVNQKVVLALNFNSKAIAWAGVLETPTALGDYLWTDPQITPLVGFFAFSRRPSVNTGDGSGDDDSGVQGFGAWDPAGASAAACSQQNNVSATVTKMHTAGRLLSIPRNDGTLTGSASSPAAADAILADAVQATGGLLFSFTRTSATPRMVPALIIGDEFVVAPDPVELELEVAAPSLVQYQFPDPVELPLAVPNPNLGLIRPDPVELELVVPEPMLQLPLPPIVEEPPRAPLAAAYGQGLLDLLPRGLAWTRAPESNMGKLMRALGTECEVIEYRGQDLVREADARRTHELLAEWEELLRTRIDCPELGATEIERRYAVLLRLSMPGGQNAFHYSEVAKALGYDIEVEDFEEVRTFRVGVSTIGDALAADAWRFVVIVHAPVVTPVYFRTGLSQVGDPLVTGNNHRLECELDRVKPAHVLFLYSYDKPFSGYSPWHIIGPVPVPLELVVPIPLRHL